MLYRLGKKEAGWKNNLAEAGVKNLKLREEMAKLNGEDIEVQKLITKVDRANSFYQDIIEQLSKNEPIKECL